jgi:hypothetical protein
MTDSIRCFIVACAVCAWCTLPAVGLDKSYDVVVAGAGTGGVAAAIQAARQGVRVALVEETDWIGGQMTAAAVSTMDEGDTLEGPQGIYDEFKQRVGEYYSARGKSVGTCYYRDTSHCYEPSVAQTILYNMIDEVNRGPNGHLLDVFLRHRVVKVLSSGKMVTGVVTQDGTQFDAKVLIDATEFGDLLPLSPAAYRSGNNLSTLPPHRACVQFITYVAVIKEYPKGVPPGLVMNSPPPGYDDEFLQNMRPVMQRDGNPASRTVPVSFVGLKAYRGIPDSSNPKNYVSSEASEISKTSLDWFNDYPATTDIFDREKRKAIVCAAKLKTLDLLYYVQHEMKESSWSVANDEGFDTPYNREENMCPNIPAEYKAIERNFPLLPYVRESQRLVGVYTLTSLDMRREGQPATARKHFETAVALGDYANDLHGCGQEQDMEGDLEHSGDLVGDHGAIFGPFQVPEAALIPRDVDGFLVAEKNLSQSRLANGGTRLQPVAMVTGEAAGALAALAVKQNKRPREVPIQDVQKELLRANSSLTVENITDGPARTDLWRSMQFTVVHGWLSPRSSTAFGYGDILTRGELAQALARAFYLSKGLEGWIAAFGHSAIVPAGEVADAPDGTLAIYHDVEGWRKSQALTPRYADVPLYSQFATSIEEVGKLGAMAGYGANDGYFFPGAPATEAELVQGIRTLVGHRSGPIREKDEDFLRAHDLKVPLSKGNAAVILYWYGTQQSSWAVQ